MIALKLIIFLCVVLVAVCCNEHSRTHGERKLSAVDDSIYDVLIQYCKGKSLPLKSKRSKLQKAHVIRLAGEDVENFQQKLKMERIASILKTKSC